MNQTKIVSVANHKGGVGKTTLAVNLVWWFAEQGHRVLAIDLDGQGNFTGTLLGNRNQKSQPGGSNTLFTSDGVEPVISRSPDNPLISVIHGTRALDEVAGLNAISDFMDRISHMRTASVADRVVIDTMPALGAPTQAALAVSDLVVTPMQPEQYSLDGFTDLRYAIQTARKRLNHTLKPSLTVVNMVQPRAGLHVEATSSLEGSSARLVPHPLHRRIAVADAISARLPVWKLKRAGAAGAEWRAACAYIAKELES